MPIPPGALYVLGHDREGSRPALTAAPRRTAGCALARLEQNPDSVDLRTIPSAVAGDVDVVGLWSHLSRADEPASGSTEEHLAAAREAADTLLSNPIIEDVVSVAADEEA